MEYKYIGSITRPHKKNQQSIGKRIALSQTGITFFTINMSNKV